MNSAPKFAEKSDGNLWSGQRAGTPLNFVGKLNTQKLRDMSIFEDGNATWKMIQFFSHVVE